jgi:formate dehydrogenase gamma subunit
MEQRTVRRFRTSVIWIHWLHMVAFAILAISGSMMFFHLANFSSGAQIHTVHRITAAFFVLIPVVYSIAAPVSSMTFLKEAFLWNMDDIAWLKASLRYYFYNRGKMPPQGRINGDQKLWQLVVILTSVILIFTGVVLWFFKFKIPRLTYQGFLLAHSAAFIVVIVMFLWHFYIRSLHPNFGESLSSMIDGKISETYAAQHYAKWYAGKTGQAAEQPQKPNLKDSGPI